MKSAIFIFDGITQVVLTPEGDLDKRVLELIEKGTAGTMRGSVYECRGGWIRFEESRASRSPYDCEWPKPLSDSESLIVRVKDAKPAETANAEEPR